MYIYLYTYIHIYREGDFLLYPLLFKPLFFLVFSEVHLFQRIRLRTSIRVEEAIQDYSSFLNKLPIKFPAYSFTFIFYSLRYLVPNF